MSISSIYQSVVSATQTAQKFVVSNAAAAGSKLSSLGRTVSAGYTNYAAPAVNAVAKGVFSKIGVTLVLASSAAGLAYKAFTTYKESAAAAKGKESAAAGGAAAGGAEDADGTVDGSTAVRLSTTLKTAYQNPAAKFAAAAVATAAFAVVAFVKMP